LNRQHARRTGTFTALKSVSFNPANPANVQCATRVTLSPVVRLSVREEQILALLSQGFSNKLIADKLELSIDTVCSHLKHVFDKLHVSSRTEAVVRYMASKSS